MLNACFKPEAVCLSALFIVVVSCFFIKRPAQVQVNFLMNMTSVSLL